MARKTILILGATALSSLFMVAAESGVANAVSNPTNIPGHVTCSPAGGVWSGVITFAPPLMNGGTASTETLTVKATLGNTGSSCVTTAGIVALGTIKGTLTFSIPGTANNCATIFSGVTLPAPAAGSKFKMTWTTPAGFNPTNWTNNTPAFKVTGAASLADIVVKKGAVAGSFTPLAAPKATLSDANWPGAVATGCASSTGLGSLTLSTSSGKW
ncbi:MAG: hypothetical protein ACLP6E_00610 [Acidimicrobiales bacterium]